MNTKIAAFIIAFLAIFSIVATIRMFKKDKLSTRLLLMWLFIWFAIGFFALFPFTLNKLMKMINMGNRMFFLTSGSILILYLIIFYISSNLSKMNRHISKLTQEIALLNYKLDEKQKNDE